MRDSINYNLKYFIMKMSSTKPMKNTMRKPSPLKFAELSTPEGKAASKVGATVGKKAGTRNTSARDAAKPAEGKPKLTKDNTVKRGMFRVSKEKAAEVAAKKAKETTKPVEGKPSSKPTTQGGLRGALEKAKAKAQANKSETTKAGAAAPKKTGNLRDLKNTLKARSEAKKAAATTKPVEGKPSAKPATKSVTKEMIGGGGVPQLRKHKR
jgi:hypothetical protein